MLEMLGQRPLDVAALGRLRLSHPTIEILVLNLVAPFEHLKGFMPLRGISWCEAERMYWGLYCALSQIGCMICVGATGVLEYLRSAVLVLSQRRGG